ncbi:hypothetical protein J7K43_08985 [Candidatus Calescamantes bacterium]|nr:hypothetical protein [Candidatus Calescamantes bacterium]
MKRKVEMVSIPKVVLENAEGLEDIEDWFLSRSLEFLEEMRRIRKEEDLKGKGFSLEQLCKKWNIKL